MSYGSQFRGRRRVAALFGEAASSAKPSSIAGVRQLTLSGSGAYQQFVSVTGRGCLNFAMYLAGQNNISTTNRVIVDGRTLFTATETPLTNGTGRCVVGAVVSGGAPVFQPIEFVSSLLIEATWPSGVSTLNWFVNYEVDA